MKHLQPPISATLLLLGLLVSTGVMAQTANATLSTRSTTSATSQQKDLAGDLATANLANQGITNPSPTQLAAARQSVLDQRAQGMGWGQIANQLGLNLGKVISAAAHADNETRKQTTQAKSKSTTTSTHKNSSPQGSDPYSGGSSKGAAGSGGRGGGHGGGGGGGK